jgi:hypothetical protein
MNQLGHIFNAFSQFCNALIGGHSNESVSGRSYREGWKLMYAINAIFFWQSNHCRGAHHKDVEWAKEFSKLG